MAFKETERESGRRETCLLSTYSCACEEAYTTHVAPPPGSSGDRGLSCLVLLCPCLSCLLLALSNPPAAANCRHRSWNVPIVAQEQMTHASPVPVHPSRVRSRSCSCTSTWFSNYRSAYVEHYTRLSRFTGKGPFTRPRSPETRRTGSEYWVAGKSIVGRKMGEAWLCSYVTHRYQGPLTMSIKHYHTYLSLPCYYARTDILPARPHYYRSQRRTTRREQTHSEVD